MAFDDDKPHDWDPEKEKRSTDPDALARSFVRAAADEQAKIEKEEAARRREIDGLGRPPVSSFLMPAPPTLDLQMGIHKIRNGFVVIYGQSPHGHTLTLDQAETEYAKDPEAALAIVQRVTREFFLDSLASSQSRGPMIGGDGVDGGPPPMPRRPGDPG